MTTQKTNTGAKQAKAGAETVENAVNAGQETFGKAAEAGTEAVAAGYEQVAAMTQEQLKTFFPAGAQGLDDFADFNKGNLDAAVKAGTVAAKGFETIGKEVMAYHQQAFEAGMDRATALLGCKTLQDFVEVQTDIARSHFDAFVAQGTRISEISVKATNEAAEPINVRVNEATEKFTKAAAI